MLQKQAVKPELLELLEELMLVNEFTNFNLVGGTALALYEGHRLSVDIDLFGRSEISPDLFTEILKDKGETTILSQSSKILIYVINKIKVDFVDYNFQLLEPVNVIDGIRLVSKKDIAAMKLNAIAGRGSKKDFVDVYQLLNDFSLSEMLTFYAQKYPNGSEFMVLKSLLYFDDAEIEPDPIMLIPITWSQVKERILHEVKEI
jgi:predicted nucleotidyltransferase component of viral defense system